MPPFTTLADAVHLAESDMQADPDSVHSFEVRLQSPAITFLMFHSRLFWSLPPIPLKSSHCSTNIKGKYTTMWETPLHLSNVFLWILLCRLFAVLLLYRTSMLTFLDRAYSVFDYTRASFAEKLRILPPALQG